MELARPDPDWHGVLVSCCFVIPFASPRNLITIPAVYLQEAKQALLQLSEELRAQDREAGVAQSAIGDLLFLYASTVNWFKALRTYKVPLSSASHCNQWRRAL